ncbi:DUF5107 domain-containing protein [Flagellimonas marina]|uniref:DUF5107 domain-containing protein n=1 Tax=Flagellimonas marina TaxID=1775168 RepID=A0ABV8PQ05_9FLAO
MIKRCFILALSTIFTQFLWAQKATITEEKVAMKTYMFSDPNPIPDMNKNYPYFRFDGYTDKSTQKEWNMVILENDYIKVYINTDIGGKIWGAIEKSTGGEFLYYNDVVKFRDVAQRGAWTSGGLEYNFGVMGHTSTTSTPQDYVLKENADGSVSCIIGALDLHTNTKWNVEVNLQKDKAFVEVKSSWFNTGNLPVSHYHYSNAAAKASGNLEFIYPGNHYVGHAGEVGSWPSEDGKEISFYEKNNFGTYKSYHVVNSYADFMGGYWHDDNFGFGNIRDYDKMPGRKIWIWGLAEEGMIWEDLLTDSKGQYIEYQTGSTFNQAMESSTLTPFKHREFAPYDSDLSSELYFPLKNTGGMDMATEYAVLNVIRKNSDSVQIKLSALSPLDTKLKIKVGEKVLSDDVKLNPLELHTLDIALHENEDFNITLGDNLLSYTSENDELVVDRPIYPNEDFDWDSAIGLYTKGIEAEKQYAGLKNGARPLQISQEFYLKSLKLDPAYAPALNRVAFNYYRMMQYDKALEYAKKALSINTYDPDANYLYGIINAKLKQYTNAKSGLAIASESTTYRSAAYTELAKLSLLEKKYGKAIELGEKALMYNQANVVALEIQAVAHRLQNNTEQAKQVLSKLYDLDNTSAFVAFERTLHGESNVSSLKSLITNELPAESYIELAVKYNSFRMDQESIKVLKAGPENAKILLLLAHLDSSNQTEWLNKGLEATPFLVFPFRAETYTALDQLMEVSDHWKLKYYAALALWKKERLEEAKQLFLQCKDQPDYVGFYLSKAKLFQDDDAVVKNSLAKAKEIAPKDWRVDLALIDQHLKDAEYDKAAKIAKSNYSKNKELSIMGMRYARALLKANKLEQCLKFLEGFEIIPFEGATEGREIYYEAHIKSALASLKKGDYTSSIEHARKAKLWPTNLGSGEPYDPDERLENAILAYSYEQLNNAEKAQEYNALLIDHGFDPNDQKNAALYLQFLAHEKNGEQAKAQALVKKALAADHTNVYYQWVNAKAEKNNKAIQSAEDAIKASSGSFKFLLLADFLKIVNK